MRRLKEHALVAQSVEQSTENPRVGGSSPPQGTISFFGSICGSGSVVEHRLAKARVASSNLVFRSSLSPDLIGRFLLPEKPVWCDGEVVTLRPAKPPFVGSNPTRTSIKN